MPAFLVPTTHLLELVVRAVGVYAFLLVALRLAGRRELAQMTSFDLVLLLLISNAVQNSINAGDNSLGGGLVSALVLVVLNKAIGWAAWRWRWAERLLQGRPIRVITDGKVHLGALKREQLTLAELRSALRKQGVERITDCAKVVLEPDGTLSVLRTGITVRTPAELAHPQAIYRGG
ncbi:MAG TPA: YetF domain-containing protein [Anaeromyxobacteraceae bacterium]|nr:YetF domain-containing protein [Anaeromyxobacteraceae bacterium]